MFCINVVVHYVLLPLLILAVIFAVVYLRERSVATVEASYQPISDTHQHVS